MLVVKLLRNGLKMAKAAPNPAKVQLRNDIAARIAALTTEEKRRQSQIVYEKVINHPWYKSANRISLYMSTDQEIDTAPLISHIKARGTAAFVPQYAGGTMRMLKLEGGDENTMPLTRHGIQQHSKEQLREDAVASGGLDLIIAPGVAFSKSGDRCGHGGGYYDKFIANLRSNPKTAPKVLGDLYIPGPTMSIQMMTRKATVKDTENKLKLALLELKKYMNDNHNMLFKERSDCEGEIQAVNNKVFEIKRQLTELHIEYMDVLDQRDRLEDEVRSFSNCSDIFSRSLSRSAELQANLNEAHIKIISLEQTIQGLNGTATQNLYSELEEKYVVAVAFDCQVVDKVPTNEQDQKVDAVIYAE